MCIFFVRNSLIFMIILIPKIEIHTAILKDWAISSINYFKHQHNIDNTEICSASQAPVQLMKKNINKHTILMVY